MPTKGKKRSRKPALDEMGEDSSQSFRPSEYMRARRPELFSDSKLLVEPRLTREVFEFQLQTITKHKKEIEFEHFCRRLAEKEICPNLIPQTGPTGGGDSKVDTETYPVADQISLRWYEGVAREASQERWAFAFSAKEDWRSKVSSDVRKIVGTKRGYEFVYFITNQFVKDKARAEVEDKWRQQGVDVRILDASWIVKSVFEHDRVRLAAETLNLADYDETSRKQVGPQDVEREAELEELEAQISDPTRYQGVPYQLAEDCLEAALLARALERPRVEVDGRFDRAQRTAEKAGFTQQRLRVLYKKAWTAFWWYDDIEELNKLYDLVEPLAIGTLQAFDLELLTNLWSLVSSSVKFGSIDRVGARLEARTKTLIAELERVAEDDKRPNNSLQAQTSLVLVEMSLATAEGQPPDSAFAKLRAVLTKAQGLSEYPVEPLVRVIRQLGEYVPDSAAYDELFEVVVGMTSARASQGEAGCVLLEGGYQKLRAGRKYDAIRMLGRAQQMLALDEYRREWISALAGCALAYESAGLLWAARANMLMAANQALSAFWKEGKIEQSALVPLRKLIWLELQLGRVPCVLAWIETASLIAPQLGLDGDKKDNFLAERRMQDMVLALLILKTEIWKLKWLDFLPELLREWGLDHSWMACLYALGYEDYLRSEQVIGDDQDTDSVRDLFARWLHQPASADVPDEPELLGTQSLEFRSVVLGCEIVVETTNSLISIYLAETILGGLESLLATSLENILPYRSMLRISVKPSDFISGAPEYRILDVDGDQTIQIRHSPIWDRNSLEAREAFRSWLLELMLKLIPLFAVPGNDPKAYAEELVIQEQALGRALNFSDGSIAIENILGNAPRIRLSDWEDQAKGRKRFELRRTVAWDSELESGGVTGKIASRASGDSEAVRKSDSFDVETLKHRDRQVLSIIKIPLWNDAKWRATVYAWSEDPTALPFLALGFENEVAAKKIFEEWRYRLGNVDKHEQLYVSVVTGVDRKSPSSYCVIVGIDPEWKVKGPPGSQVVTVSRINRMDPRDSRNLNAFLEGFKRAGAYVLLPAHFTRESEPVDFFSNLGILKKRLRVISAWELTEHDPDIIALDPDDDPIIPDGVDNAPVIRTLESLTKLRSAKARKVASRSETSKDSTFSIRKTGRNQLCWCGSGKKFKKCHGV